MKVRLPRKMGARLALYVLLLSLVLAVAGAAVQLVVEYRDERELVELRLAELEEAYLKPLASSLWATDDALVDAQLEGIVSIPEIERVSLVDEDGRVHTAGSVVSGRTMERSWPIVRGYKGRDVVLGELRVVVGLDPMIQRVLEQSATVFGAQALIILAVSTFLFVLMHFVVTRRVAALSARVRGVRPDQLDRPLTPLSPPSDEEPDEIGSLVESFEVMRRRLAASYAELSQHRRNLAHEVSERTAELGLANEQLRREVEERARAQEALRDSENRLRVLLQHVPGAMWTVDRTLRVTSAGGARVAELDVAPGHALDRVLGGDGEALRVHRLALAGEIASCEILRGGSVYELTVEPLEPDEAGAVRRQGGAGAAVLAIALDVTERRRAESERLEKRLQEAQRLESLGLLAGGIAHDFNNLLVGVLGNASLARMQLQEGTAPHRLVSQIEAIAQRAADLTAQMLAYSGRGRFVVEPIDLAALGREMAGLLRASIAKKIELRFESADHLDRVEADVSQMRQLVMNLITNAADAIGDAEGVVTVETRSVDADRATLEEASPLVDLHPGRYVVLRVTDTGSGMDEATRERMFEPFFTTKPKGHGLGLAACLGIVRGHRGTIQVESAQGRGTAITVMLPATQRAPVVDEAPEPSAMPERTGGTVLVVDDDPTVRLFLRESLQHAGFEVLEAEDGVEGLAVYAAEGDRVDIVVLDMTMPRLDGEETFRELRRRDPDVQVLLSSGYDEQEASARLSGDGLAGFLQKPYRASEVIARIASIVARHQAPVRETGPIPNG